MSVIFSFCQILNTKHHNWSFKLKFLIQYLKFPITEGPNLYLTGSKIEVEKFNCNVIIESHTINN